MNVHLPFMVQDLKCNYMFRIKDHSPTHTHQIQKEYGERIENKMDF